MSDTPLIPTQDLTVYAILEDFGKHGAAWREIDEIRADERSIIEGILRGVTTRSARCRLQCRRGLGARSDERYRDIVLKVVRAARQQNRKMSALTRAFIERITGQDCKTVVAVFQRRNFASRNRRELFYWVAR